MPIIDKALTAIVLRAQKTVKRIKSNGVCEPDNGHNMKRLWEINSDLLDEEAAGIKNEQRRQLGRIP